MPGFMPGIHVLKRFPFIRNRHVRARAAHPSKKEAIIKRWIAGSRPAMTHLISITGKVRKNYAAVAGGSASTE
jgi:hypothetical protein